MARPKQPLLSREAVIRAAVEIIDRDGLDTLSLPALAHELGVRAPSLYHHFRDKAEILAEVARSIVLETAYPRKRPDDEWLEWMVELCVNFRRTVLSHRGAAPLLLQFLPRDVLVSRYEHSARKLTRAGVPEELHLAILDGCEKLALGSSLTEAMQVSDAGAATFRNLQPAQHERLLAAVEASPISAEELFRREVRNFLMGCLAPDPVLNRRTAQTRVKPAKA